MSDRDGEEAVWAARGRLWVTLGNIQAKDIGGGQEMPLSIPVK